MKDEKVITKRLAEMALKLLPDYPNPSQPEQITPHWGKIGGKAPTEEQQAQLAEFARLVASKMPSDRFAERMQQLLENLRFVDDPYGRNYQIIFTEMSQWVLNERKDTQRNYDILGGTKPDEYTIRDKVRRPIHTKRELEEVLASLPVEPMPDTRDRDRTNEAPEMVRLDSVVGGTGIETWFVNASEDRWFSRIFELIQNLQSGNASVVGRNDQLDLLKLMVSFMLRAMEDIE